MYIFIKSYTQHIKTYFIKRLYSIENKVMNINPRLLAIQYKLTKYTDGKIFQSGWKGIFFKCLHVAYKTKV